MWQALLLLNILLAAMASLGDMNLPEKTVEIGSLGITYVQLKGLLVPVTDSEGTIRSLIFRTDTEGDDMLNFQCSVLGDRPSSDGAETALLCRGEELERDGIMEKTVFLFEAEGFRPTAREIELSMERSVVASLVTVPGTLLGTTILGDRA